MSDLDSIMNAVMSYVGGIFGGMFGQTGQTEVKLMVMGDGLGNLLVPPEAQIEPGEVWVHTPLGGDKRSVFKVLDPEGVGRAGEWVCVGKAPDSNRVVVLGRLQSMISTYWQDAAGRGEQVPLARRHAAQHHAAGDDPLKVDWKQIVNLALVPVPGELKLRVVKGFYRDGDTLRYLPHGLLTDDLSSYKPASTDDAVILMVCLDPETQVLSYAAGDEFTVDRTKTVEDTDILDVWSNAPSAIPSGKHPLGCALLTGRTSMTEFLEKHVQAHVAAESTPTAGGGGEGDSTYSDDYADRPSPSNAGDLFFPRDGFAVERDTSAAWEPWGPLFPFTAPAPGDFSWVNQGSATLDASQGGMVLRSPPAGVTDSVRALVKAAPSTPYTVTAYLLPFLWRRDYVNYGLLFRESSSGKLTTMALNLKVGSFVLGLYKYNSPTSYNAAYTEFNVLMDMFRWLRLADDGTDRSFSVSVNGQTWVEVYSVSRTDFLTPDQVGFFLNPSLGGSLDVYVTLMSWEEA